MEIKRMPVIVEEKQTYSICEIHGATDPKNTGVCSRCGAKTILHCDEEIVEELNVATFTAEEVNKAIKAKEKYRKDCAKIRDINPNTKIDKFVKQYFGELEEYGFVLPFEAFKGTNKNITAKLKELFSELEYHDTFRQCGIELRQSGDVVLIYGFDY